MLRPASAEAATGHGDPTTSGDQAITHARATTTTTGATSAADGAAAGAGDDDAAVEADWWLANPFLRRCKHGGRGLRRWERPFAQWRPRVLLRNDVMRS